MPKKKQLKRKITTHDMAENMKIEQLQLNNNQIEYIVNLV